MRKNPKSQKLCSPSAELIGGNDYFLGLIFPRLPVRSLSRFKSVAKQWCALISDPEFRRRHSLENPSSRIPSGLYLYNPDYLKDDTVYSITLSKVGGRIPSCSDPVEVPGNVPSKLMQLLPERNMMRMIQSSNGLCLFTFSTFNNPKALCVRNLVTNELKVVPLPKLDGYEWIAAYSIAFDPLMSPHYKVLCVKAVEELSERTFMSKFMIFSSETGQWVDTHVTMSGLKLQSAKGEYCHGAIYWIVKNKLSCYRFDIEAENLTEISMPPEALGSHFRHFGESYGHLYLVGVRDATAKTINVYELDLITMKWIVKHWVHIDNLISSFPHIIVNGVNQMCHSANSILSVLRGEQEEDSSLVINNFGKVILYNFKSKKVEVLLSEFNWKQKSRRFINASKPQFIPAYPFMATLYPLE